MSTPRIGIWFIGARGGVAATATLGLLALGKKLAGTVGLISELPQFAGLDFADWDSFVVGGHEIRGGALVDSLGRLVADSRVLDADLIDACREELVAIDARIRPGTLANCGPTINSLAGPAMRDFSEESAHDAIARLQADLRDFERESGAEYVIVVNLASTEPVAEIPALPTRWDALSQAVDDKTITKLPASSLYAIAALDLGFPYINFTPSLG